MLDESAFAIFRASTRYVEAGSERMTAPVTATDIAEAIERHCRAKRVHPMSLSRGAARAAGLTFNNAAWSEARRLAAESIGMMDEDEAIPCPKVPEGQRLKGLTTYEKLPGGGARYVKTEAIKADEAREAQAAMFERIAETMNSIVKPRTWKVTPPKADLDGDLLSVIVFGDPHLGMHAVASEAGQAWDLQKGVDIHRRAIEQLVTEGVRTKKCVIIVLGDTTHSDTLRNATTKGTPVEVDGSHLDCIAAAYETLVYATDIALAVHDEVELVNLAGNHDKETAYAVSLALSIHYKDEARVTVPIVRGPAWRTLFGEVLIAATHGDTLRSEKPEGLMLTMANDWPREWGASTWRFWLCGHVHHRQKMGTKEVPGGEVVTFRTLVPQDRYHAHAGYRAKQDARKLVFHKTAGQRAEHIVTAEFLAVAS